VVKTLKEPGAAYGASHYWLVFADGDDAKQEILDLNFAPGEELDDLYPYDDPHVRKASWLRDRTDSKLPARHDTKRIIEAVRAKVRSGSDTC
jgi:hypothetical protein